MPLVERAGYTVVTTRVALSRNDARRKGARRENELLQNAPDITTIGALRLADTAMRETAGELEDEAALRAQVRGVREEVASLVAEVGCVREVAAGSSSTAGWRCRRARVS